MNVEDDDPNDFHCSKFATIGYNAEHSHFIRVNEGNDRKYIAIIPPFYIYWWENKQTVSVETFGINGIKVYEDNNIDINKLSDIYERFKKLQVFS